MITTSCNLHIFDSSFTTEIDIVMKGLQLALRDPYEPTCQLIVHDIAKGTKEVCQNTFLI